MAGFAQNVLASSVALLIILAIMGVVYLLWTRMAMKKKAKYFEHIHTDLAAGQRVMFGGGMFGTVKKVKGDTVDMEIAPDTVVEVSRYAIQQIDGE